MPSGKTYEYEDFNQLKSGKDLVAYFNDELNCRKFLEFARWGNRPQCTKCDSESVYKYPDRSKYRCKTCGHQYRLMARTVFQDSPLPLTHLFDAVYQICCINNEGTDAIALKRHLGIAYKNAWYLHHRVMALMQPDFSKLIEYSGIKEYDELFIGLNQKRVTKKKLKKLGIDIKHGGVSHKQPIFVIVIRGIGVYGIVMPKNPGKEYTEQLIRAHISKDSIVFSDASPNYSGMKNEHAKGSKQFRHVREQYGGGDEHSNTVEGFNSHFRVNERHYKSMGTGYLQSYYNEFSFHGTCSMLKLDIFEKFMFAMASVEKTFTLAELKEQKKYCEQHFREYELAKGKQ